ncbi:MAG: hypothetical protein O3B86_04875, partial [Planctomycetota bacterium]|nr:hypothetical protein [Planctomycetota bacterium]
MLFSSWLKRISNRIRGRRYKPDRKPKKPDRYTQLGLTKLEDRVVLSVSASFDTGVLDLMLSEQNDVAEITVGSGGEILINNETVAGGSGSVLATDLTRLTATDASALMDQTGQEIRISDVLDLSNGLLVDASIETTTFDAEVVGVDANGIDVGSGTINLNASLATNGENILFGGNVIGEALDLTLATGIDGGRIQIDGSLNGTTGTIFESLTIDAGSGDVLLNSVGMVGTDDLESLTITSGANVHMTGNVSLDATLSINADDVSIEGDVATGGSIDVNATDGAVRVSGALDTSANAAGITLSATDGVQLIGAGADVTTGGGAFTVDADSDDTGAGRLEIGRSGAVVDTTGATDGAVTVTATDVNLVGTIDAGTATVTLTTSGTGTDIYLGTAPAQFSSTFALSSLAGGGGASGFELRGAAGGDISGLPVTDVGDVNGDGIDDFAIGAYQAGGKGRAYIVFGAPGLGAAGFQQLSALDGSDGFEINGLTSGDRFAGSISAAGDINGDGVDDLIIGAREGDPGARSDAGEAYVIFGSAASGAGGTLQLTDLDGSNGFVINGETAGDKIGLSVSGGVDVNNDGIDDVLLGSGDGNARPGIAYVVFGSNSSFSSTFELSSLDGSNGFVMTGIDPNGALGQVVLGIDDLNGDGIDDF